MVVDVETLSPQGERFAPLLAAPALAGLWAGAAPPGGGTVGPATAGLLLRPAWDGVDLSGRVRVQFELPCDRCARPVLGAVEEDVRVRFERVPTAAGEHELREGELNVDEFDGRRIDLDAWLAEQASLMLPEPLLCRPDCRGLCGRCGADLNEGDCGCPAAGDPRWAALKDWTREA